MTDWKYLERDEQVRLREAFGHYLDSLPPSRSLDMKIARFDDWLRLQGISYQAKERPDASEQQILTERGVPQGISRVISTPSGGLPVRASPCAFQISSLRTSSAPGRGTPSAPPGSPRLPPRSMLE